MSVKVHVLQTFGFEHGDERRELARGLHQIDGDVADSIRSSALGASLLEAGLIRFVEEAQAEVAPKPKRRRKKSAPAESSSSDAASADE